MMEYKCSRCGAAGCKLWRWYNTLLENQELFCVECACAEAKQDDSLVDVESRRPGSLGLLTGQIGFLVPAVPTPDGSTFWGYLSVPDDGVAWWRALPTRPVATTSGDPGDSGTPQSSS